MSAEGAGRRPRPALPRAQAAVRDGPWSGRLPSLAPRPPVLAPLLRGIFEHAMVAGPIFGVLNALYGLHLAQSAPLSPDLAAHATLRQTVVWHGQVTHVYYITPGQNALSWALAVPAMAWLVLLVVTLIALGVRTHLGRKRGR